ncbi:hypothetical protein HPB48_004497 [Haemaphysalis longicornis]|uniref:Uncharacterized protein n=1 Tax=Haemaphysalis longicornis TaxID=44386 RepID=A0A9J6GY69_HAELO|nr:hypothetical protein HPB48_004497 [Haemaphysalis longicornis]
MADEGFTIEDILELIGVHLNKPHFLKNGPVFEKVVAKTEDIASLQIDVERLILKIKSCHMFGVGYR